MSASHIAKAKHRTNDELVCRMASFEDAPNSSLSGIDIPIDLSLNDIEAFDLVVFPAIWRNPKPILAINASAKAVIMRLYQQGSIFAATGTGTWILAELGLLDGKAATTHWYHLAAFKKRYPTLNVRSQHLITQADRIYCAASLNSLADLTIHLIETLYDLETAIAVEQQFSPEVRQAYRSRVFIDGADNNHNDEVVIDAQLFIRDNYQQSINFLELASSLGISQRTLNRRFLAATSLSPGQYLQRIRSLTARDLLQHSNLSIAEIAIMVGFNGTAQFSDNFRQHHNVSPSTFRSSVKSKLFSS